MFNVAPASQTLAQHQANIGLTWRVFLVPAITLADDPALYGQSVEQTVPSHWTCQKYLHGLTIFRF